MSKYNNLPDFLADLSHAIKIKKKKDINEPIAAYDFSNEVMSITSGGGGEFNVRQVILDDGTCELHITDAEEGGNSEGGFIPEGTITIKENGTYDVTNYATADVSIPTDEPNLINKEITENGVYSASADGADGYSTITVNITEIVIPEEYVCKVVDYDGSIIKEETHVEGETFTLPPLPTHDGLIAQGYSSPIPIENNQITVGNSDVVIGVMYETSSGLTEIDVELNKGTGLTVTLKMDGTKNWGDGTSDNETTHTYAKSGRYTIRCDGATMSSRYDAGIYYGIFDQGNITDNYYCTGLRIGSSVTSIPEAAFQRCKSLTTVTIPNSVTAIKFIAFSECDLRSITVPTGVTELGNSVVMSNYNMTSAVIPYGVTSFTNLLFGACYSLTNVTIPNSVVLLDTSTLSGCQSLKKITVPESVTKINNYVFNGCTSLTEIIIPASVTSIGSYAFSGCTSLVRADILARISELNSNMFEGCSSLISINVPDSVQYIYAKAFIDCKCLKTVYIPDSVTYLSSEVFRDCHALEYVRMPKNSISIGTSIFRGCWMLKNIIIPNGITTIPSYAFPNCFCLTSIVIPYGVTKIDSHAFNGCSSILTYDFRNCTSIPTLDNSANVFLDINKRAKIIVPDELYDSWIAATNWSSYASYIYKVSEV